MVCETVNKNGNSHDQLIGRKFISGIAAQDHCNLGHDVSGLFKVCSTSQLHLKSDEAHQFGLVPKVPIYVWLGGAKLHGWDPWDVRLSPSIMQLFVYLEVTPSIASILHLHKNRIKRAIFVGSVPQMPNSKALFSVFSVFVCFCSRCFRFRL